MESERFIVKCITVNNCFVYFSDTWLRKLETKENVIKIVHKGKIYYASCNARPSQSRLVCFGTTFARSLNIEEEDEVFVSSVKDVPLLNRIDVVPCTAGDREILELQIEKVQSIMLSQIRVVAKGQPIIVWVSKFSSVTLIVESLEPSFTYGKLEQFTEVHVSDAAVEQKSSKENLEQSPKALDTFMEAFKKFRPLRTEEMSFKSRSQEEEAARNYKLVQSFRNRKKPEIYRVHPLSDIIANKNEMNEAARHPYHIFLPRDQALKFTSNLCRLRKVPEDKQYVNVTNTGFLIKDHSPVPKLAIELVTKLFILEELLEKSGIGDEKYLNVGQIHKTIYVSESLRITLGLRIGAKVSLWQLEDSKDTVPSSIDLFSWRNSVSSQDFENYVRKRSTAEGLLINSCATIILDDGRQCVLKILPESCAFAVLNDATLKKVGVHSRAVSEKSHLRLPERLDQQHHSLRKVSTRHLRNILFECQLALDLSLGLRRQLNFEYARENILISGEVGSGKSTICKVLIEHLRSPPYFAHTHMIDCRSLKGKKAEILQKIIIAALTECVYLQPSVLFLDDLESITNASTSDEENTPDSINAARIVDMLMNIVTQYQEIHYISIIATCAGVNRIGQKLRPARGSQFFRTILSIPNIEKVDRIDILQLMLGDKLYVPGDVNWDYYGNKTEGWMIQDLVDMAEKAAFSAWKRHGALKPPIVITEEDVCVASKNCTPMSLQGIQLYKDAGHVWSDIGGLAEVKKSLIEILQWPLKYPEIFKSAPIKLQNGILLYGMPGTGKTMLAKAIANECDVNLISVKGPELLSKYIGVSEESVRNVFERALRAKPCVLFFDEFDSLAPRRGHDSTGVTDRVVNQLLTQMDGVEDREGVAVVAATSRPDLLDPALLRPGRLDKALYCPLPDEKDREEVLAALCETHKINTAELNLKEVAALTSGFTGADLNAVVTQARLSAFEDAVATIPDGKIGAEDIKVTQNHLRDSAKATQPSLSTAEKEKYKRIYGRFAKSDDFMGDILRNQKATLA
ncbi:peroxisomal biogenesis factor 1 [Calliopsis andreniformis]|uniref:peroxisomal biogenesis factor 1 n=1 Tax=Calliopsis andreniformis TaxID=337506 RepID=UPI003FCDAAAF